LVDAVINTALKRSAPVALKDIITCRSILNLCMARLLVLALQHGFSGANLILSKQWEQKETEIKLRRTYWRKEKSHICL